MGQARGEGTGEQDVQHGREGRRSNNAPRIDRFNVPSLSPESESPPHCRTTAEGRYHSMICEMTCRETGARVYVVSDGLGEGKTLKQRSGRRAHGLENALVRLIGDTISQWEVDGIVLALSMSDILLKS